MVQCFGDRRDDPAAATAVFGFCARVMDIGVQHRAVFDRLAETGARVHVGDALTPLEPAIGVLLERAQAAGAIRQDLEPSELIALLSAICQEAMADDWSEALCQRALAILFDGMRPGAR